MLSFSRGRSVLHPNVGDVAVILSPNTPTARLPPSSPTFLSLDLRLKSSEICPELPTMSASSTNIPPDVEEALVISDQQMVFRSKETSSRKQSTKKMVLNTTKARSKLKRNTLVPPIKGNGRKRFGLSPLPENKQLCKRIVFGAEDSPTSETQKCKGLIFPANPHHGVEESLQAEEPENVPNYKEQEMGLICSVPTIAAVNAPDSGHVAGGDEEEDNRSCHSRPKVDGSADAKGILGGELVNLPKMELETKPLYECCLVPCHLEGTHDALAVEIPMQPKRDNILQLASFDSAEVLDSIAAQPPTTLNLRPLIQQCRYPWQPTSHPSRSSHLLRGEER